MEIHNLIQQIRKDFLKAEERELTKKAYEAYGK